MEDNLVQSARLREQPEEILQKKTVLSSVNIENLSPEEIQQTVYNLQIYQIELEMQNNELRRKQAELDASQTRHLDFYDLAPVGYVTLSDTGLIVEANLTAASFLGVDRNVLVKQPITNFIFREDQDLYYQHRKRLLETGEPQKCDLRMVRKDGTELWIRLNSITAHDPDGVPVSRLVLSDITERKQAYFALRENEERYRDLVENVNSAIIRLKDDGTVIFINDFALNFFGYREDEIVGRKINILLPEPESTDPELSGLVRKVVLHPERFKNHENENVCRDGRRVWMSWANKPIFDNNDQIVEFLTVGNDITARKQMELYREMGREILQALNDSEISDSFQKVVDIFKKQTGFDAVGIRLQDGNDFPYFACNGFSQDFIQLEHTLIGRTGTGELCRDEDGNIRLECTCGLILSGKTDPANPLFTPGGSFWTNDSLPILDILPSEDSRFRPRNRCIFHNYASFALVPIRNKERIVGLLQFNDHRKGCFTLDLIETLEAIASHIGASLMRRQAEMALQESEANYRALFENMTNGFAVHQIVVDDAGHPIDFIFREVNNAFEKHTGLKPVDVLNKYATQVLPGIEDRIGRYGKVALTGGEIRSELYSEPLGRWYTVIAYRPKPNFFAAVFEDITEKKRIGAIQSSLAAIVASSEDAIIGTDLNGIIQTWNVGAENIYGYTAEEVIGKNISLLIPLGQPDRNADILKRLLRNEKVEHCEVDRIRKDGTIISVSIFVSAIKDASGTLIGISRIAHDITKQQHAEAANVELERRVEERTQELRKTQKQFLHAEKLSAIGQLAASIAHEFNNPLQGILSILKGVKKRATMDEEDKELLEAAISEGDRIKELIRNLQEFNRPSSGRKTAMDLHSCLDSILILQKSELKGRRITVVRNYAEQLPQIMAVPDQIKQVFLNLLTNAADACNHHGGVITISTRGEDDNRVAVAIKDTGTGIETKHMEQIFKPFYSTKGEIKGTGLGLSVSHGIIQDHQGEIRVESQPGEGATFTVLLPIKGAEEKAASATDR